MIDFAAELTLWLRSADARDAMKAIVAEAVKAEISYALDDELVDVEHAAVMLDMSPGALRKAAERGQVPCQRIGRRLRFRRTELINASAAVQTSAVPRILRRAA